MTGRSQAAGEHEWPQRLGRLAGALAEAPVYALLLPVYLVLLLYADNVVDVRPTEVAGPTAVVLGVSAALLTILARLWHSWPRAGIVVFATVVPFMLAGLVVDSLAPTWSDDFQLRLHIMVCVGWLACAALGVYAALKLGPRLRATTQLLNVVSVVLFAFAAFPVMGDLRTAAADRIDAGPASSLPVGAAGRSSDSDTRDILHLVFDRYGSERSLAIGQGIDNSEFIGWLREHGFQVVNDARANFERTALSLSAVHDMSLHTDLIGSENPDYDQLVERIRSSRAAASLKGLGYEYIVAGSWWGPSAYSHLADRIVEPEYMVSFGSALVDRTLLPSLEAITAFATSASVDGSAQQVAAATEGQFRALASLMGQPGPQLIFAHFLVPHDPYVFLADGTVDAEAASYQSQLRYTNEQLKVLIEPLLELPEEERPIIILQADEGPYPERYGDGRDDFDWAEATDDELVTKFGVLDAFYLPGSGGEPAIPSGMSLVNTYPEVLRRYHGLEVDPIPDQTFAMVGGDYFTLIDITERVNAAFGRLVPSAGE